MLDPIYRQHDPGQGHPERPERYAAVTQALEQSGLSAALGRISPRVATEDEIALCHSHAYIPESAARDCLRRGRELSTGDTDAGPRSWDVALQAVGGVLNAIDAVIDGGPREPPFCAVRPPGHHARPEQGMGFCIFNNVAVAARYAQRKHGICKVLIADWDVHHGNGTQDTFYGDGSVFFFSTHQSPWYPFTGSAAETGDGKGKNCTMNCPFPAGSGRDEIDGAFRERLRAAADLFKPDLVMISAGFDSRVDDPLGKFTLSDSDFADLTSVMKEIAGTHAGGRLVSVLEGGYNPGADLASAHRGACAGSVEDLAPASGQPQQAEEQIDEVEIQTQRSEDGLLASRIGAFFAQNVHGLDRLRVVGGEPRKHNDADQGVHEAHAFAHQRGEEHGQETAEARPIRTAPSCRTNPPVRDRAWSRNSRTALRPAKPNAVTPNVWRCSIR